MTLAIIDYDAGNLLSLTRAFATMDEAARIVTTADEVRPDDILVLPGVGAAGAAMDALSARGFATRLQTTSQPILGICLGMQLLFDWQEEGDCPGLGLLPGTVRQIPATDGRKVPHMGWNRVTWGNRCALAPNQFAGYFVHSYHCEPQLPEDQVAWTDYAMPICAAVHVPGIIGVQFHPEKSGAAGLLALRQAVELLRSEARE